MYVIYLRYDLAGRLRADKPIHHLQFLSTMAKSVAKLHELGYRHGDLKLGNFFVDTIDNVVLGDFGLSHPITSSTKARTPSPAVFRHSCGTPKWRYPLPTLKPTTETGHFKHDIFQLGMTFLAVMAGKKYIHNQGKFEMACRSSFTSLVQFVMQHGAVDCPSDDHINCVRLRLLAYRHQSIWAILTKMLPLDLDKADGTAMATALQEFQAARVQFLLNCLDGIRSINPCIHTLIVEYLY
jgi:serine/threonine protein kinase